MTGRFTDDGRGVSTALGYVLTLGITAVLISGLLVGGASMVRNERQTVAQDQLAIAGEQLTTGISDADRLASAGGDGTVRIELWLPREAGGDGYTIRIEPQSTPADQPNETRIVAESSSVDVTQFATVRTSVPVAAATIQGGPVVVSYVDTDGDGDRELLVESSRGTP
jgi:hypothetical protein